MADKIDMSLDEIIKRDRISTGRGRRGGKFAARKTTANTRGRNMNVRKIGATARQMKASGGGGGVGPRRNLKQTFQARKITEKWVHDKFTGDVKTATLIVSNLDYNVSDQDIRELFAEFGPLKKAAVHYDSSGRSLGQAEVIFFKIQDSVRALNKYNGIPLDGRPMNIKPVVNALKTNIASRIGKANVLKNNKNASTNARGRAGIIAGRARRGRGGRIGQRGGGGQRGAQRQKVPTVAELDADLDAYANKM